MKCYKKINIVENSVIVITIHFVSVIIMRQQWDAPQHCCIYGCKINKLVFPAL